MAGTAHCFGSSPHPLPRAYKNGSRSRLPSSSPASPSSSPACITLFFACLPCPLLRLPALLSSSPACLALFFACLPYPLLRLPTSPSYSPACLALFFACLPRPLLHCSSLSASGWIYTSGWCATDVLLEPVRSTHFLISTNPSKVTKQEITC